MELTTDSKIWAIVSGEYSDYRVHCCFTTRDLAIQYAASVNGLTIAEQTRYEELQHLPWNDSANQKELHDLDIKTKYRGYRLDSFDLYDHVPHANPAT